MNNYYEILGVPKNATYEEIRVKYRFLVRAYHPDKFIDEESKSLAENELKKINEAYTVLSNPVKRAQYDDRNNGSDQETSKHKNPEDDVYQKFYIILNDLRSIREIWKKLIPEVVVPHEINDEIKQLTAIFDSLYRKVFLSKDDNFPFYLRFPNKLREMMELNYYLGAEIQQDGHPKNYTQNEVDIASITPTLDTFSALVTMAVQKKVIDDIAENELYSLIFQKCLSISYGCRDLGAIESRKLEMRRNSSNNKKNGTPDSNNNPKNFDTKSPPNYCQTCGELTQTRPVIFRQNVGVFFRRYTRRLEGYLCADCVEKYFWQFSGVTLLFGWWGVISFVFTPLFLIGNFYNFLKALPIRKYGKNLSGQSVSWKLLSLIVISLLIILIVNNNFFGMKVYDQSTSDHFSRTSGVTQPIPSPIPFQSIRPSTTPLFRPSPTIECINASDVTKNREGQSICVIGLVRSAYWGGQIFYITFSNDPEVFRLIVNNGYYYKLQQGDCVKTEGIVKLYGNMPYIEIDDNLRKCN